MITFIKKTIILSLLLLTVFFTNMAFGRDFSGRWCWDLDSESSAFCLIIHKINGVYNGGYFSVALHGNRIDDNNEAFSFKLSNKVLIKTRLKAGITGNIGWVQLNIIGVEKLEWLILKMPKGEIYVPKKATLHRC